MVLLSKRDSHALWPRPKVTYQSTYNSNLWQVYVINKNFHQLFLIKYIYLDFIYSFLFRFYYISNLSYFLFILFPIYFIIFIITIIIIIIIIIYSMRGGERCGCPE